MPYPPEEDSYLMKKEVEKYISKLKNKKIKVLDMGTGTGIQAQACVDFGVKRKSIICADIDSEAILLLKNEGFHALKSDLFSNIPEKQKFDLIIFNAPYLPEDKKEHDKGKDTTAGKRGNEIILRFLKEARDYISNSGKILLLFSSLSKPQEIFDYAKKLEYKFEKLSEEKLFFERLWVYEFYR